MLSALIHKKSKMSYYDNLFKNNLNDGKNTWKGIRNILWLNQSATSAPNTLSENDESISDPIKIANIFNNLFSTIAAKTKSKIKFSQKQFSDFLRTKNLDTFFIFLTFKDEMCNVTSSLNPNKTTGPFHIPLKILQLLQKDIILLNLIIFFIFQLQLLSFLQILKLQKSYISVNKKNLNLTSPTTYLQRFYEI